MSVVSFFRSGYAQFEEKMYGWRVGYSVYVGILNGQLQDQFAWLRSHRLVSVGVAFALVCGVQLLVALLAFSKAFFTMVFSFPFWLEQALLSSFSWVVKKAFSA